MNFSDELRFIHWAGERRRTICETPESKHTAKPVKSVQIERRRHYGRGILQVYSSLWKVRWIKRSTSIESLRTMFTPTCGLLFPHDDIHWKHDAISHTTRSARQRAPGWVLLWLPNSLDLHTIEYLMNLLDQVNLTVNQQLRNLEQLATILDLAWLYIPGRILVHNCCSKVHARVII